MRELYAHVYYMYIILYRHCNLNLHTGVNIFINLVSPNLKYLEQTLDRIWNTESGRLFPAVRREFHSPLVTKPALQYTSIYVTRQ